MRFAIVAFTLDLLADAGELLAGRHAAERAALPLLPPRFSEPAVATKALEAALARPHATGVAAIAGERLLGFLVGDMVFDTTWGRAAWVRLPGYALAADQSVELLHDLYAALGKRWLAYGCYTHFALVSTANAALLDAWFRLSFGVEQTHALLDLAAHDVPPAEPRFAIRRATMDDGALLASFASTIWQQQVAAPTWAFTAPERPMSCLPSTPTR